MLPKGLLILLNYVHVIQHLVSKTTLFFTVAFEKLFEGNDLMPLMLLMLANRADE